MNAIYFKTAAIAAERIDKINRDYAVPTDATGELKELSDNIRNRLIIPVLLDALRIRKVRQKVFESVEHNGKTIPISGIAWLSNGGRLTWKCHGEDYALTAFDVDVDTAEALKVAMARVREVASQIAARKARPKKKVTGNFSIAQAFDDLAL